MNNSIQAVQDKPTMQVFEQMESQVRSYCRNFTAVFTKASNAKLWDSEGNVYIDFFAGAGAVNYGHNNPAIRSKIVEYMLEDGITHSLDMATGAKESFLLRFQESILKPRGLSYKIMFPGPTGTNSVESALKIARKVTGRSGVICFTNAFHGMTLGSLAATGNKFKRGGAGIALSNTTFMPFDGYFGDGVNTTTYVEKLLDDPGSGVEVLSHYSGNRSGRRRPEYRNVRMVERYRTDMQKARYSADCRRCADGLRPDGFILQL